MGTCNDDIQIDLKINKNRKKTSKEIPNATKHSSEESENSKNHKNSEQMTRLGSEVSWMINKQSDGNHGEKAFFNGHHSTFEGDIFSNGDSSKLENGEGRKVRDSQSPASGTNSLHRRSWQRTPRKKR